jgi:Flp pilus assembly CpaE family ATPase
MTAEVEKVLVTETQVVVSQPETREVIVTGLLGPKGDRGASTIAELEDVNLTSLTSGSVLVYDTNSQKWISKTLLNQQQVDCGEF